MKTEAIADIEDDLRPEYELQALRLRKVGPARTRGPQISTLARQAC